MPKSTLYLLCTALLIASSNLGAQVYEWRDARGVLTYGDRPPSGVEARRLGSLPSPERPSPTRDEAAGEDSGAAEPNISERLEEMRARREAEEEAREAAEQEREREAARARQCDQAHNHLAALESGQRVARFTSGGEREFLDEEARADEVARTRDFISDHCN